MIQQILLGVDMDLSPATQTMLQTAKSFLVQLAPQQQALLLAVIPVPYDTPSSLGRFRGQAPSWSATTAQRTQAHLTAGPGHVGARGHRGFTAGNASA